MSIIDRIVEHELIHGLGHPGHTIGEISPPKPSQKELDWRASNEHFLSQLEPRRKAKRYLKGLRNGTKT